MSERGRACARVKENEREGESEGLEGGRDDDTVKDTHPPCSEEESFITIFKDMQLRHMYVPVLRLILL